MFCHNAMHKTGSLQTYQTWVATSDVISFRCSNELRSDTRWSVTIHRNRSHGRACSCLWHKRARCPTRWRGKGRRRGHNWWWTSHLVVRILTRDDCLYKICCSLENCLLQKWKLLGHWCHYIALWTTVRRLIMTLLASLSISYLWKVLWFLYLPINSKWRLRFTDMSTTHTFANMSTTHSFAHFVLEMHVWFNLRLKLNKTKCAAIWNLEGSARSGKKRKSLFET